MNWLLKLKQPIKAVMTQTHPMEHQRIHHLVSLPIQPPPMAAKKKPPAKKDIEANPPFAITVTNNMTSPITTKVTVYGMRVCTFSFLFTYTKFRFTPIIPISPFTLPPPSNPLHLPSNSYTHTHTQPISYQHRINHYVVKQFRRPLCRSARQILG